MRKDLVGPLPGSLSVALLAATLASGALPARSPAGVYGTPWNADGLANLEVGRYTTALAHRFRADYTGEVRKIKVFFVFRTSCDGCYMWGDGGQVEVELRTDDGSVDHFPSNTVLASALITDPTKTAPGPPIYGVKSNSCPPCGSSYRVITLDTPASLEQGELYHLVYTNPSPNPRNNYVSLDELFNAAGTSPMQPEVSDLDWAMLANYGSSWGVNLFHTPILEVWYDGGSYKQGIGYIDAYSQSGIVSIFGANRIATRFIVSGGDRTISRINVRVRKVGAPGRLSMRIEKLDGTLVRRVSVPALSVPTSMSWVSSSFLAPPLPVLANGESYRLVLSASGSLGNRYETFGMAKGTSYGFSNVFADGWAEVNTGTGWKRYKGPLNEFQTYFTVDAPLLTAAPTNELAGAAD